MLTNNQCITLLERMFTGRRAASDLVGHLLGKGRTDVVRMCNDAMGVQHIAPHYVRLAGVSGVLDDLRGHLPPGLSVKVLSVGRLRFVLSTEEGVIARTAERSLAIAAGWSWYLEWRSR